MEIWEPTSRVLCVNTVVLNVLRGKTISKNRLARDVMFDCKVSHHHVRFDSFLHLTQVFSRTVEVTFPIADDSYRISFRTTVYETQCCSRDIEDGQWGQMGGSPKALATASGRGNQPAEGPPESNCGCPGPRNIRNEPSFWISSRRRLLRATGSSINLERITMDLSIDHFAKAQARRGACKRCYFWRQLQILNLCGTGTGCRVCRAERLQTLVHAPLEAQPLSLQPIPFHVQELAKPWRAML